MHKRNLKKLPPLSRVWLAFYGFAAFWLVLVASLDASHFGPGFFPLIISLFLVPLFSLLFLADLIMKLTEAIQGTESSLARRCWPVVAALLGCGVYGGVCVIFMIEHLG